MFTKTYTDEAVAIARRISNAQKKELEHLKVEELGDIIRDFAHSLDDVNDSEKRDMLLITALSSPKANTAAIARQVAEMVLKTHGVEAAATYKWAERNGFYMKMVARRDKLFARAKELATDKLTNVGWSGWQSYVDDYVNVRAEGEATAELVAWIESMCWHLSLGEAAEHALSRLQETIIRDAGMGTSRSTSQVHNVAEAALMSARVKLLDQARYSGIKPVDHRDRIDA